ncbi:hypothetical protein NPIL_98741 [Nephila pilipes]|uniref:Spider venom protein n=1 Tax=Nephila pilipes TaxID=299642 RepID=A0A8X6UQ07_NEPPI|nr:hypothetical protein NPIL_98741 [Nephila pilipes]
MNLLGIFALVSSFTTLAFAEEEPEDMHPPPDGPNFVVKALFPACLPFSNIMENKAFDLSKQGKLMGLEPCDQKHLEPCIEKDANTLRCEVPEEPSEECMAQITAFLKRQNCNK